MIYALQGIEKSPVKFGYSRDQESLWRRIATLQTAHPYPLRVLHTSEGTLADEQGIHGALKGYRLLGEWFEWCTPVERFLDFWRLRGLTMTMNGWAADESGAFEPRETGTELYVSEGSASELMTIKGHVLKEARLAGVGPPFRVHMMAGRAQRYYRVSELKEWLGASGVTYRVAWHEFMWRHANALKRAEDFEVGA